MKIAIIGTGISGLSTGRMLQAAGHSVILFEKQSLPGGLIKCERVKDCLFHKVGGHVFNSRNQKVLDWFWSHFDRDKEFVKAKRNAKVFYDNRVIGYPIENYLYLLEKPVIEKVINELLVLQQQPKKSPFEYEHFESFMRNNFGDTLFNIYFEPYNRKIWQADLSTVAMEWLEGKLPMPNPAEMLLSNILREEETGMVHASFYYAREGGSQFIVDRLSQELDIKRNHTVTTISKTSGRYTIQGESGFDSVIYCGDIRQLPAYWKTMLRKEEVDVDYLEQLRSNGTSNLFCETDDTDISWLYIPQSFTKAHRIIYTGNFSDSNNRGSDRKTCVVEFSGKVSYDTMVEEIKKLPGNLSPIAANYEPNSYVVQDKGTRPAIGAAKKVLEKDKVFLLGRFAEWEYYNMDKCIEAAFALVERVSV